MGPWKCLSVGGGGCCKALVLSHRHEALNKGPSLSEPQFPHQKSKGGTTACPKAGGTKGARHSADAPDDSYATMMEVNRRGVHKPTQDLQSPGGRRGTPCPCSGLGPHPRKRP